MMPSPWRLRLFYGLYFSIMGLMLPFFPLYLAQLDYTPLTIAIMMGVISLARVAAPPIFGHWLDADPGQYHGQSIVGLSMLMAVLAMMLFPFGQSWLVIAVLLLLVFSMVWAGLLAPVDALTVRLGETLGQHFYARIRLWGSLGFIVTSLLAGWLLGESWLSSLPMVVATLMLAMAVICLPLFDRQMAAEKKSGHQPWSGKLRRLMLAAFLMQCSHGAYYTFYSLQLEQLGYGHQWIGAMWMFGVLAEVVFMAWAGRFVQRYPLALMLQFCFALTALRWLGIASSEAWWFLVLWQALHAISFAAFHLLSVTAANRWASPGERGITQGWLAAFGFGGGGTLGVILAGAVVEVMNISVAFMLSAIIACAGALLYASFTTSSDKDAS